MRTAIIREAGGNVTWGEHPTIGKLFSVDPLIFCKKPSQSMRAMLLVDDDEALPLLLKHAIRQSGIEVDLHSVGDGDEAVQYLTRFGQYADESVYPVPSLILLDLKMPKMNGFQVLAWKQTQPQLEKVPVVIWSSSNLENDRERALGLGAVSYFVKPMETSGFVELLEALEVCSRQARFALAENSFPKPSGG